MSKFFKKPLLVERLVADENFYESILEFLSFDDCGDTRPLPEVFGIPPPHEE
jgi:hypothetical protein